MYKIIKNYRNNDKLRKSFNELAEKTFGLNFEDWYQNGFWTDNYNPYSIVINEKVIANVSVNKTNMLWNGEKKTLVQLGTVMTEEGYRNQGFIRKIMEEIEKDYADQVDGMYLFANDDVVTFYPKFGFRPSTEVKYFKTVKNKENTTMLQIPMSTKKEWDEFQIKIKNCKNFSSFEMIENSELYMFYISKFMQDSVYYCEKLDAYVIAEIEDHNLYLHAIVSENDVEVSDVIKAFGTDIQSVTLGFTPIRKNEFLSKEHKEEDCTLFLKGKVFDEFQKEGFMFQTLAHA